MKSLPLVIFAFILSSFLSEAKASVSNAAYQNPIIEHAAGADPAVLYYQGKYYTYTTNSAGAVYISEDLVHWEKGPRVLPERLSGAWAPEVYFHPEDQKFYMYYTDRYKIGVAVSDRPDEQFEDLGYLTVPTIDAHPFRDDDGQLYLFFVKTPESSIYCMPMTSPTEPGGPVTLCFEISQDWEKHDHPINEGPWMLKRNGTYYLFYSGSNAQTVHYSVGYATAPTPLGPYTKFEGNPVIEHTETVWGPGHGSFEMDRTGQLWHLYHQKTGPEKGWKRFICLDPLTIDDETGEIWGIPTKGEGQPAPILDPNLVWIPQIAPRGAYFYEATEVSISSRTPDTAIYYTLDGSEPTESSSRYTGPFTIDRTCEVRARAFKEGMTSSHVAKTEFYRTNWKQEQTPITPAPSGNPPFRIYPSPNPVRPPVR